MKTVFCDFDETLLVDWHVPEVNRKAIERIRSQGHRFVACSGRPPFMITDILEELGMDGQKGEYYISCNGGIVADIGSGEILYDHGLVYLQAEEILAIAEKYAFSCMVVTNRCFHIFHPLPSEVDRKTNQLTSFELHDTYCMEDVPAIQSESISKVMFVSDDGVEQFKSVAEQLPSSIRERYEISFSSGRFMEFNRKGVSKGSAMEFLVKYLKLDIKDTIAIGDSFNDISMIVKAGIGACVASADEDVKEQADYVTERDYTDGAVAEVLEKFCI